MQLFAGHAEWKARECSNNMARSALALERLNALNFKEVSAGAEENDDEHVRTMFAAII